jgi:membrane protein DedA with SNARE-associated domain
MHSWLDWLGGLPSPLLYGAIAIAAFAENIFPPLPADTVVALGAFVAARGSGSALGAWAATMFGNVAGAMSMFALGRRLGIAWFTTRYPKLFPLQATTRVAEGFRDRGVSVLVVSRFLPGVRAVVPPVAGAMGMPPIRAALAMGLASGAWYGVVCWLAFTAGANAEQLLARIATQQRLAAIIGLGAVVVAALAVFARRRPAR